MGVSPFDDENAILVSVPYKLYTHAPDSYTKLLFSASELLYVHVRKVVRDNAENDRLDLTTAVRIKRGEKLFDSVHATGEAP